MKIALVIYSLDMGGAERVMSIMANYWASHDHEVCLISLAVSDDYYRLDKRINRVKLDKAGFSGRNIWKAAKSNVVRIRVLRQQFRKLRPDVVVSFTSRINVMTLLATRGLGMPVLVSERTDPTQMSLPKTWYVLRWPIYRQAHRVVVQSNAVMEKCRKLFPGSHLVVIPNPIYAAADSEAEERQAVPLRELAGLADTAHVIVGMGRFDFAKGFDLLIEAFATIANCHPDWFLVLIGDGAERENLLRLVADYKLRGRVSFVGRSKTPQKLLSQSDVFVLPSRFEGFPNTLLEAMACGVAVASSDCPSGPGEIIRPDYDGILVENRSVEALAQAMSELILNPAKQEQLGRHAREVLDRFSTPRIMNLWESQFPCVNTNE